eukprot:scaffold323_cov414-Prasinococcus_capsulatus_cf.AAC.14
MEALAPLDRVLFEPAGHELSQRLPRYTQIASLAKSGGRALLHEGVTEVAKDAPVPGEDIVAVAGAVVAVDLFHLLHDVQLGYGRIRAQSQGQPIALRCRRPAVSAAVALFAASRGGGGRRSAATRRQVPIGTCFRSSICWSRSNTRTLAPGCALCIARAALRPATPAPTMATSSNSSMASVGPASATARGTAQDAAPSPLQPQPDADVDVAADGARAPRLHIERCQTRAGAEPPAARVPRRCERP